MGSQWIYGHVVCIDVRQLALRADFAKILLMHYIWRLLNFVKNSFSMSWHRFELAYS